MTSMVDEVRAMDIVYLDFSKAIQDLIDRLLIYGLDWQMVR